MALLERKPHKVVATYLVDVEVEIDARTPEEAETIFDSEYAEEMRVMAEGASNVELLEVAAYPADEEDKS